MVITGYPFGEFGFIFGEFGSRSDCFIIGDIGISFGTILGDCGEIGNGDIVMLDMGEIGDELNVGGVVFTGVLNSNALFPTGNSSYELEFGGVCCTKSFCDQKVSISSILGNVSVVAMIFLPMIGL